MAAQSLPPALLKIVCKDEEDFFLDFNMLYTIATFHDIAHHIDKKNHEKLSAEIFYNNEKMKKFFDKYLNVIIILALNVRMLLI